MRPERCNLMRPRHEGQGRADNSAGLVMRADQTEAKCPASGCATGVAALGNSPAMPDGSEVFFENLDMWLLPAAESFFVPGEAYDGELRETWAGFFFEFDVDGEASGSFVLLNEFDQPFARGRRIG